jgi:hypothetical protein
VHAKVVSMDLDDAVDDGLSHGKDLQGLVVLSCNENATAYCPGWRVEDV